MSSADLYRGKYGGPEAPATEENPPDGASREDLQRLREQDELERAFAGIDRIDQGKYYAPAPQQEGDAEPDALRADFEAALAPPAPPKPATPVQRPSLADTAPLDVHTYNMRGLDPDKAVGKLGLFVDLAQKDGHSLIRLRVGSNPPLLTAVRAWLKGPGLTYVEEFEVAQEHEDAAVFARIRRKRHA